MAVERGGATGCGSAAFSVVPRPPAPPPPTPCRRSWGGHAAAHGLLERAAGSREDEQPLDLLWRGGGGGWRHEGRTTRLSCRRGSRLAPVHATSPQQAVFPSPLPCHAEPRVSADATPEAAELWRGSTAQHRPSARIRGAVPVPKARSVKGEVVSGERTLGHNRLPRAWGTGQASDAWHAEIFSPSAYGCASERVRCWSLVGALSVLLSVGGVMSHDCGVGERPLFPSPGVLEIDARQGESWQGRGMLPLGPPWRDAPLAAAPARGRDCVAHSWEGRAAVASPREACRRPTRVAGGGRCCQPRAVPALRQGGQEQGHRCCVRINATSTVGDWPRGHAGLPPPPAAGRGWANRPGQRASGTTHRTLGNPRSKSIQPAGPSGEPTGGPDRLSSP